MKTENAIEQAENFPNKAKYTIPMAKVGTADGKVMTAVNTQTIPTAMMSGGGGYICGIGIIADGAGIGGKPFIRAGGGGDLRLILMSRRGNFRYFALGVTAGTMLGHAAALGAGCRPVNGKFIRIIMAQSGKHFG